MPTPDYIRKIYATPTNGGTVEVTPGLHLFRVPKDRFRAGQSYGLIVDGGTVLIDAVHETSKPAVDALIARHPPKALILTHGDLIEQAFGTPAELSEWLGHVPIFIHSKDSGNLDKLTPLETSTAVIADLGFYTYHIGGHTPGSTAFLFHQRGWLFTGDAIVGGPYDEAEQYFTHSPMLEGDFLQSVRGWEQVPLNLVEAVLPLHGQISLDPDAGNAARDAALLKDAVVRDDVMRK